MSKPTKYLYITVGTDGGNETRYVQRPQASQGKIVQTEYVLSSYDLSLGEPSLLNTFGEMGFRIVSVLLEKQNDIEGYRFHLEKEYTGDPGPLLEAINHLLAEHVY